MSSLVTIAAAFVGIAGVIGSLIFSGWQTRQLVYQTKIQNKIAASTIFHSGNDRFNEVARVFIDYPELRSYFYDGAPVPNRGAKRSRVLATAEMLADIIDSVLYSVSQFATRNEYKEWVDYAAYLLDKSPAFAGLILEHLEWWPEIVKIINERQHSPEG